jgi:CubicO group peptidase (beta-lactamase class C family)
VLVPAGMLTTGYGIPDFGRHSVAHNYFGGADRGSNLELAAAAGHGPFWNLIGNGGLHSTVWDMYRWHVALAGDDVLSHDAKAKAFAPHVLEGDDPNSAYGYGWGVLRTARGTRVVMHNGSDGTFTFDFRRYLDDDVLIIVFSNVQGQSAGRLSSRLTRTIFVPS